MAKNTDTAAPAKKIYNQQPLRIGNKAGFNAAMSTVDLVYIALWCQTSFDTVLSNRIKNRFHVTQSLSLWIVCG